MALQREKNFRAGTLGCVLLAALWAVVAAEPTKASINYGDFGPVGGINFLHVTESSGTDPVPLFGPPKPFFIGLDFDPQQFTAFGNGGGNDFTDGQLNFAMRADPGTGIGQINLFESGDYTLAGLGTAATQAFAGAIMRVTVTQIDGVNVTPITLSPFSASAAFNLPSNPGVAQPWSLAFTADINGALTALGRSFDVGATGLEVVINNSLGALSEAGSIAFISKKDFVISVVPEPTVTALLAGSGLVGFLLRRRARR